MKRKWEDRRHMQLRIERSANGLISLRVFASKEIADKLPIATSTFSGSMLFGDEDKLSRFEIGQVTSSKKGVTIRFSQVKG